MPLSPSKTLAVTGLALAVAALSACKSTPIQQAQAPVLAEPVFEHNHTMMPFEDRSRRKWDAPVVADLDHDGLQDLIINDHGRGMSVLWNNGGSFTAPERFVRGDVHGIAVDDFNGDGQVDLIIAQGGGDGKNPKRPKWFSVNSETREIKLSELLSYFEPIRGRLVRFSDIDNDGDSDLLTTGFPLPRQKEGANIVYLNNGADKFEYNQHLPQAQWMGYRATVMDINDDNDSEVVLFGGEDMVMIGAEDGTQFSNVTQEAFGELANLSTVSTANAFDYDNDGDLDLIFTRSEPQFHFESYYDQDNERLAFISFRTPYKFEDFKVDGNLEIENLQITYPHRDVYLGANRTKVEYTKENHGGHELVITPEEAAGWPEGETTNGMFIGYLGDGMWRVAGKSHSRSAAVFKGVKTKMTPTPQEQYPVRIFQNNAGQFTDVTELLGIDIPWQTTGAATGDFNNDGWQDVVLLHYGNMAKPSSHTLLLSNEAKSFSVANGAGIFSEELGVSGGAATTIDADLDGDIDIVFSQERGRWHMLENTSVNDGEHNWVGIKVETIPRKAGTTMLNARLTLKACGEIFTKVVGEGSVAFSQGLNTHLHVGLGQCLSIESADVTFSNGDTQQLELQEVNTYWEF